ncbi:MAG: hypothetical protein JWR26_2534 [Pedosphaera sp.]|nr:hypothetical protein [Pedosphaera sp.]
MNIQLRTHALPLISSPDPSAHPHRPRLLLRDHLAWALSLFLVGLGAKLWLILNFASSLPFFDQWDAEAVNLYLPFLNGHLTWAGLLQPHGEHRITLTRLYDLALLVLNGGQWDSRLQMVVSAMIHCGAISGLGWMLARLMGRRVWPMLWPLLALVLVLPFAWENTLAGFQSQFYFLLIGSMLTLRLLGFEKPLSFLWWLGVVAAVVSLFTMASGFLACGAVSVLIAFEIFKQKRLWRQHLPTLGVCLLIGIAGLLLKPSVPETDYLRADSLAHFQTALARNLAWPRILRPAHAVWNILPLLCLAWVYLRPHRRNRNAEKMILGMAAWVFLQSTAAAYARGGNGFAPASRYMDSSCFIMIVNCLGFYCLLASHFQTLWLHRLGILLALIWGLDCLNGLWQLNLQAWSEDIPERAFDQQLWLKSTRAFLATDDVHVFNRKNPIERPYPKPERLAAFLRNPKIRDLLPACVREPLHLMRQNSADLSFVPVEDFAFKSTVPTGASWTSRPDPQDAGHRTFESLPLGPGALPYLEFPITGHLGEPGLSLELLDLATGRTIPIKPPQIAGEKWMSAYVKAPAGKFKILAADESRTSGFAFKEPRELGRLSFWTIRILSAWKYFLGAGLLCLCLAIRLSFQTRATRAPPIYSPGPKPGPTLLQPAN